MNTSVYRADGQLTGTIEPENLEVADAYLRDMNMTDFIDPPLNTVVAHIEWHLEPNGNDWYVQMTTERPLTDDELKTMSEWVSGQNSDGLGESFEQQSFAEILEDEEVDCSTCNGYGHVDSEDEDAATGEQETCDDCGGSGVLEREEYGMISFDWMTNKIEWKKIV